MTGVSAYAGNLFEVESLLAQGASPKVKSRISYYVNREPPSLGKLPIPCIIAAIMSKSKDVVRCILDHGAGPNTLRLGLMSTMKTYSSQHGRDDYACLAIAVHKQTEELVSILLEYGADITESFKVLPDAPQRDKFTTTRGWYLI